ncbi:MAG: hypothetical protein A2V65_07615 [Deltaproteobacteria bacterium RBG_13_49_15]|nr:MAG: hypothetical protein A2V65_07615 [Deltaproteobacteria bacterium RBG_13_49_15]
MIKNRRGNTYTGDCLVFIDGFVKSPPAALRCIPQDLRALDLKRFTLPSQFRFVTDSPLLNRSEKMRSLYETRLIKCAILFKEILTNP